MFSNFLYFIVVLLIYNTYQPSKESNILFFQSLSFFAIIIILFFCYTRISFRKLENSLTYANPVTIDQRFTSLQTRQSILSVGIFAIYIYALNLPAFFFDMTLFRLIPTLLAIVFISLFVIHLAMIWASSYSLYQKLYRSSISKKNYILSNISFSIPVLLPWMLLSGIADLINALPLEWLKNILASTLGQVAYFVFFLFVVAIVGPVMIQHFWRCTPLEQGLYRHRIEALCSKAGLKYSNILYWPIFGGRMITAGVMGLVGRFRYILVTNGLLRLLTLEEIDAVIAHEIGHIKCHHLLFYLFFFIGYPFLYFALQQPIDLFISFAITPHAFWDKMGMDSAVISVTLFNMIMIITFLAYFRYIFGYFMRNFERQADTYVYSLFNSAKPLISTFQKIAATSAQPADKPNWHHFSIKERIDFLVRCETNPLEILRHNRKIRNSIVFYLVCLLLIGSLGYQLNFSSNGHHLRVYILEKSLLNEISRNSNNPELHNILGMLYHDRKEYAKAIKAYENSLKLLLEQDQVLNNLSWIYATCEYPVYRNPQRALILAKKAAELNPSAEILDTLAESYYVNGEIEKAVETARKALVKASADRKHFEEQLSKFEQTLK